MTDKNRLKLCREWAERVSHINESLNPELHTAAEVIRDLPDTIVDGDKLARIIFTSGDSRAKIGLIRAEFNLAEPAPPVEIRLGAPAMHPDHGEVTICSAFPTLDGEVRVMYGDSFSTDGVSWIWAKVTDLSPLPDTDTETTTEKAPRPEECCGECPEIVGGGYDCTCADNPRCPNYQATVTSTEPQSPAGDAWLVEFEGHQCYGLRDWEGSPEWTVVDSDGDRRYAEDREIRRISRLVPERTPRTLDTEEDFSEAPIGTVAWTWLEAGDVDIARKVNTGQWRSTYTGARHSHEGMSESYNSWIVLWEPGEDQ